MSAVPGLTPEEIHGLAETAYCAPEAAEALIVRACDASAPELQRRAIQALRWLELDDESNPPLPFAHGGAGDTLAKAVLALAHNPLYHSDRKTRLRCARLVTAIIKEAGKLDAETGDRRCA